MDDMAQLGFLGQRAKRARRELSGGDDADADAIASAFELKSDRRLRATGGPEEEEVGWRRWRREPGKVRVVGRHAAPAGERAFFARISSIVFAFPPV